MDCGLDGAAEVIESHCLFVLCCLASEFRRKTPRCRSSREVSKYSAATTKICYRFKISIEITDYIKVEKGNRDA